MTLFQQGTLTLALILPVSTTIMAKTQPQHCEQVLLTSKTNNSQIEDLIFGIFT